MADCFSHNCKHYRGKLYWCKLLKRNVIRYICCDSKPVGCKYEPRKSAVVKSVDLGKTGEEAAYWFLSATLKAKNIHKLATDKIYTKKKGLIYKDGTPCDYICSIPHNGVFWLPSYVEVKLHDGDTLKHSVLSPNQVKNLLSWHQCNHWSFVLWVHQQECIMFKYPTIQFRKGKSIPVETAKKIAWEKS